MEGKEMLPKFRAWDKEDESWIDIKSLGMIEGEITTLEEWDDDLPYFIEDLGKTWELIQSTGLHDKNGKEIFEGDIVKFSIEHDGLNQPPRNIKYEIAIEDGVTLIKNAEHKLVLKMVNEDMEIIGNIHEHSHLLDDGGQQQ